MKLTKVQREMLEHVVAKGGMTMWDGRDAAVASRLAAKGLVTLPAGHGFYFGGFLNKVLPTDAGRDALKDTQP